MEPPSPLPSNWIEKVSKIKNKGGEVAQEDKQCRETLVPRGG